MSISNYVLNSWKWAPISQSFFVAPSGWFPSESLYIVFCVCVLKMPLLNSTLKSWWLTGLVVGRTVRCQDLLVCGMCGIPPTGTYLCSSHLHSSHSKNSSHGSHLSTEDTALTRSPQDPIPSVLLTDTPQTPRGPSPASTPPLVFMSSYGVFHQIENRNNFLSISWGPHSTHQSLWYFCLNVNEAQFSGPSVSFFSLLSGEFRPARCLLLWPVAQYQPARPSASGPPCSCQMQYMTIISICFLVAISNSHSDSVPSLLLCQS